MQTLLAVWVVSLLAATPPVPPPLRTAPMNDQVLLLALHSVERHGEVLTVKWSVRNGGKSGTSVSFALAGHPTTYVEQNGTKYYVLADKTGKCQATEHQYLGAEGSGISDGLHAGATKHYWMKLAAPPAEVKTVDLVFTGAETFAAIPITDK